MRSNNLSDLAIRVENPCPERSRRISKRYKIGKAQRRHDTLRDALTDLLPRIPRISTKNKALWELP
jgi:hypothetical protein